MHGAARPIYADSPHERPSQDDEKGFLERPSLTDDDRPYKVEAEFARNTPYGQPRRSAVRYAPSPHPDYVVTEKSPLWWSRVRHSLREPFSEFFGVFILVLFGDGAIAQVVLSRNTRGDWQSICWGWGLGVMIGVYVSGISGSNINPAVTLTNCVFRKQAWRKLPVYVAAQILGAFTAAGVIYGNYKSAIDIFEGGPGVRTVPGYSANATAGIFATYPQPFMSRTGEFFSEFLCAAILMFCIYMLQDTKNMGAGKLLPLALFFVVFGIGACFGWETGFAINMARDFGPRLMTYCLGYGPKVWTASSNYFWIPMVAPFLGCLFGAWIHDLFLFTGEPPAHSPSPSAPANQPRRVSRQHAVDGPAPARASGSGPPQPRLSACLGRWEKLMSHCCRFGMQYRSWIGRLGVIERSVYIEPLTDASCARIPPSSRSYFYSITSSRDANPVTRSVCHPARVLARVISLLSRVRHHPRAYCRQILPSRQCCNPEGQASEFIANTTLHSWALCVPSPACEKAQTDLQSRRISHTYPTQRSTATCDDDSTDPSGQTNC
ncbi:aquaporin [Blumeria hordei DH14]|uniref:Aquaporin n=1 Tax=Blumeria graminis f. sp. hordei (strain DH14) TaxID=546991 RepID=N1JQC3_BLUG1|nr:aquaporin [Blumeria hordei DH14]